jgi:thiosulfate/3-mercaptopyruvate sulfurtransferase
MATRLYWTLKYYGHNKLGILDGGTAAWLLAGNDVISTPAKYGQGDWQAIDGNKALLASTQDVEMALRGKNIQLLDTRTYGQYLGTWKKSYVYKPGHVPGAKLFPYEVIASPQIPAKFTSADDLRELVNTLGIQDTGDIITYCNSGHLASGGWFVLSEVLGYKNTKLYDGSMHEWTLNEHEVTRLKNE